MIRAKDNAKLLETRDKILTCARNLFSKFGFDGASVRDIAKESDVNLAAVNYHFQNKENLYWEVIMQSYTKAEDVCRMFAEESDSLEEMALNVFDHFLTDKETVRNTMKLLLLERFEPSTDFLTKNPQFIGPPGGAYFAEFIKKEVSYPLKITGVNWGVKSIFGTVVHWSTMCTTSHFASMAAKDPQYSPKRIRADVQMVIRSTLFYLEKNPQLFGK